MLVIPVIHKSCRKQIPFVTLTLVLINILVYFFFQGDDNRLYYQAMDYYQKSGLMKIELNSYRDYLQETSNDAPHQGITEDHLLHKMMGDGEFLSLLEGNLVITAEEEGFRIWRDKRDHYKARLEKVVGQRFGYKPVENNSLGLFTSMFLHGSISHLLGNMLFLYLVGTLLELAVGTPLFLVGYLITGVCATWLFGFAYPLSPGPLVGASGAIAGLMGGYTVIFWLKKVTIFYSLGFYFNYAKIPAITLLPFWLGNEFFQLSFNQGSNVAYMAHIGGLVSGSALAASQKLLAKKDGVDELFREEEEESAIVSHLEKGLARLASLDLGGARREMEAVLAIQPNHRQALRHLFQINKANPGSNHFHDSALTLLNTMKKEEDVAFLKLFEEYREATGKPRLTRPILFRLIDIYLKQKQYPQTEACLVRLMKDDQGVANLPHLLMRLARGYRETGNNKKAASCLSVLARRFPASDEGEKARGILNRVKN